MDDKRDRDDETGGNPGKQNRCEDLEQLHDVENEDWMGLAHAPGASMSEEFEVWFNGAAGVR